MDIIFFSLSFWVVLQTAESDVNVGEINCKINVTNINCPLDTICSGTCQYSCADVPRREDDPLRQVWGTGTYTSYSSICKAATHDFRISTWNKKERSFILKRIAYNGNYWTSIRSGIRSYSSPSNKFSPPDNGSFIFLSPRIKEKILDVASLHEAFMFSKESSHIQRCFVENDASSISFKTFIPEAISTENPNMERSGTLDVYKMSWPKQNGEAQTGGFQCVPQESMLSVVTSLAMSISADFYPTHLTYVANVNENVTLEMEEHSERSSSCVFTWKKDDEELPEFVSQSAQQRTSLYLPDIQEGSQGLYSLGCDSDPNRRGFLRLIVRACPAGKYGDNCTERCPECKNGGVCHDITGVCICPPGFNGTTCENACPSSYFGQTCTMSCPERMTPHGQKPSCEGYLICLPDPYGCSCASGYKGIFCNESYPVLTDDITLEESTNNSITISFRKWDSDLHIGKGTPSTYKVFYKRNSYEEPWVSKDVPAMPTSEKEQYEVTLENLEPETEYAVRVVILSVSGKSQEEGVKEHLFSTSCGQPMEPPLNITIEAKERIVFISWELPSESFWNCKTVKSIVKYSNLADSEEKVINERSYNFTSKPFTQWNVTVCIGQGTKEAKCAEKRSVTTKEDAPGVVRDFSHVVASSTKIYLRWKDPLEKNGIIRYFILRYRQTGWKHFCEEPFLRTKFSFNTSRSDITITDLKPSANYEFQIHAATVKVGPEQTLQAVTKIDVPSMSPRALDFLSSQNLLQWRPPPCTMSNGDIKKYRITVKGLSAPDLYQRNITTRKLYLTPLVLSSTKYNVKIFASTEAGFGKDYDEVTFETQKKAPTSPASIAVSDRSENYLTMTWEPSRIVYTSYYEVSLGLLDSSSSTSDQYISSLEEPQRYTVLGHLFKFKNLLPATTYIFSVQTQTNNLDFGVPVSSAIVSTRTTVPKVSDAPVFMGKTEDTINVKILPMKPKDSKIKYYFVVIKAEKIENNKAKVYYPTSEVTFFAPTDCERIYYGKEFVAARLESVPPQGREFTVGDGRCTDGYFNAPLPYGTYQVGIAVMSQYGNDQRYSKVVYITREISVGSKNFGFPALALGFLIAAIIIVSILIIYYALPPKMRMKVRRKSTQILEILDTLNRRRRRPQPTHLAFDNSVLDDDDDDDSIDTESIGEEISDIIAVKDLEKYIAENLSNGELKKQFRTLPKRQQHSCFVAKLPYNRLKNRYGNLLPYDNSRVKLKAIHDDVSSEYINANYVCGYKNDKRYIATQGPLPKTISDFWRMVWKDNVCKIFMVTNLVEQGRTKCEKYWPDETAVFGSITVTLKNSESLADYVIRTLEISLRKEKRELKQYHYVSWPDHGAPSYASPVIRLLKKAREYRPNSKAPIVVHCSAGVGRTGAIILLDSMLDMGMAEGQVDVCGHLCEMRKKRFNLLENTEQYVFVYKALEEALCWGETSVLCSDLIPQIRNLRSADPNACFTELEMQYQHLEKIFPRLDNASMRVARLPHNASKNRTMEILPPERARVILSILPDEGASYINAVYVNGYKEKDAFIVTQYPLPNTIKEFWHMIYQTKSRTIVLLQDIDFTDPTCPQYWPSEGQTKLEGGFCVQCISVKSCGDMRIWNLNVSSIHNEDTSDDSPLSVQLFHHLAWTVGKPLPQYPKSILDLIDKVERNQREGKHYVTVQCLNGSTACGVFCAAMFVCNKMINEQEVDLFLAVQSIRENRPQFIENFEQYDFLCDMAITFLDNFGAYANFL